MFVNQVNRRDAVSFSRLRFRHHFFSLTSTYTQQRGNPILSLRKVFSAELRMCVYFVR